MKISELEVGAPLQLCVKHGNEQLEYNVSAMEVFENSVLVEAMRSQEGKLLDFFSPNLLLDLYVMVEGDKPLVFKNVKVKCVTYKKNVYHQIISEKESQSFNRRETVRVFVGLDGKSQIGVNKTVADVIVKDVSYNGFAVVCERDMGNVVGTPIRVVFRDDKIHMDLRGTIVRNQLLENGKMLYGCYIERNDLALQRYITHKQRQIMGKNSGAL